MSATLNLENELVDALQAQARRHDVSWKEWARRILAASAAYTNSTTWTELNDRRLQLIQMKYERGLTDNEGRELTALQAAAEKHLEKFDRGRLAWLEDLERRAERLARTDG